MEYVEDRTIDDLGRIIIPLDVRAAQGWKKGTKVSMYVGKDYLILEKSKHDDVAEDCCCAYCVFGTMDLSDNN
ncbi:MAG: AbrB/MazE/SpoVT family DNA-binding domain-containing protein [Defluviitaleaceae bacterium]|nr:AbrB/MazE/SpoVT family DNA-binding domain-containing protein [Defluviitaleaceae bacterium]